MFLVVLLYMLFASTFTLSKVAVENAQPIFIVGFRMTLAGILLIGFEFLRQKKVVWPKKEHLKQIAMVALFHIYITYLCEFIALQHVTSSKACLLYSFAPFVTALLSFGLFRERLSKRQWLGLIIGFCGLLPLVFAADPQEADQLSFYFLSLPEILLLCSVATSALGWILVKELVTKGSYSPIYINGMAMFGGGIIALATSYIFESSPKIYPLENSSGVWPFLLYIFALILIANALCFNLYGYLLKKFSATFLAFAGFICPLFAALFGYIFLSEQISQYFIISLSVIFLGLYIFYKEELLKGLK